MTLLVLLHSPNDTPYQLESAWSLRNANAIGLEPADLITAGNVVNEIQRISMGGVVDGGLFRLTLDGANHAPHEWNTTAAQAQINLAVLTAIGSGNVSCTGGPLPDTPIIVEFVGSLAVQNVALMVASQSGPFTLSGTDPTVTASTLVAGGPSAATAAMFAELASATSDDNEAWTVYAGQSVDQSASPDIVGPNWQGVVVPGQTFTAGIDGPLYEFLFKLGMVNIGQSATLVCDIFALSGGLPTGSALATSDQITLSSTTPAVRTFAFSSPITQVNGTQYAAVLREITSTDLWHTIRSSASVYAGGRYILNAGAGWINSSSDIDLYFASRVFYTYSTGKLAHLFAIDAGSQAAHNQRVTFIGYGSDTTGAANKGVTLYAWHDADNRWVTLGSHSAGSTDADADKTITAELSDIFGGYVNDDGITYLLVTGSYAGTSSLAAKLVTDQLNLISFVDSAESSADAAGNVLFEGFEPPIGPTYESHGRAIGPSYEGLVDE